jgi:hypothetical protein
MEKISKNYITLIILMWICLINRLCPYGSMKYLLEEFFEELDYFLTQSMRFSSDKS